MSERNWRSGNYFHYNEDPNRSENRNNSSDYRYFENTTNNSRNDGYNRTRFYNQPEMRNNEFRGRNSNQRGRSRVNRPRGNAAFRGNRHVRDNFHEHQHLQNNYGNNHPPQHLYFSENSPNFQKNPTHRCDYREDSCEGQDYFFDFSGSYQPQKNAFTQNEPQPVNVYETQNLNVRGEREDFGRSLYNNDRDFIRDVNIHFQTKQSLNENSTASLTIDISETPQEKESNSLNDLPRKELPEGVIEMPTHQEVSDVTSEVSSNDVSESSSKNKIHHVESTSTAKKQRIEKNQRKRSQTKKSKQISSSVDIQTLKTILPPRFLQFVESGIYCDNGMKIVVRLAINSKKRFLDWKSKHEKLCGIKYKQKGEIKRTETFRFKCKYRCTGRVNANEDSKGTLCPSFLSVSIFTKFGANKKAITQSFPTCITMVYDHDHKTTPQNLSRSPKNSSVQEPTDSTSLNPNLNPVPVSTSEDGNENFIAEKTNSVSEEITENGNENNDTQEEAIENNQQEMEMRNNREKEMEMQNNHQEEIENERIVRYFHAQIPQNDETEIEILEVEKKLPSPELIDLVEEDPPMSVLLSNKIGKLVELRGSDLKIKLRQSENDEFGICIVLLSTLKGLLYRKGSFLFFHRLRIMEKCDLVLVYCENTRGNSPLAIFITSLDSSSCVPLVLEDFHNILSNNRFECDVEFILTDIPEWKENIPKYFTKSSVLTSVNLKMWEIWLWLWKQDNVSDKVKCDLFSLICQFFNVTTFPDFEFAIWSKMRFFPDMKKCPNFLSYFTKEIRNLNEQIFTSRIDNKNTVDMVRKFLVNDLTLLIRCKKDVFSLLDFLIENSPDELDCSKNLEQVSDLFEFQKLSDFSQYVKTKESEEKFAVDTKFGFCTCSQALEGWFCVHQNVILFKHSQEKNEQSKTTTEVSEQDLVRYKEFHEAMSSRIQQNESLARLEWRQKAECERKLNLFVLNVMERWNKDTKKEICDAVDDFYSQCVTMTSQEMCLRMKSFKNN